MKQKISVVIVCKNEEHIIGETIRSAQSIADEIVVYDSGSTDSTIAIIQELNATLIEGPWLGYGKTKQKAVAAAKNDWILNIDADEVLDPVLQASLSTRSFDDAAVAYTIRFRNFMGRVCLKWGEFGFDKHIRFFNRSRVQWDDSSVHERLVIPPGVRVQQLKGHILHYTMKDTRDFITKSVNYALLNAEQYYSRGKKATWIKQYLAPGVTFIKYYLIRLGFLDGWAGLFSAKMASLYTYIKYARLHELQAEGKSN